MTPNRIVATLFATFALAALLSFDAARADEADSLASEKQGSPQATVSLEGLEASTDPPWNPAHPIPRRRAWETVVLLPGRIVTLPLAGVGWVLERELYKAEQAATLTRFSQLIQKGKGFPVRPMIASLGDRTGFGLGLKIYPPYIADELLNASISGSTKKYSSARINSKLNHFNLRWGYDWRPQDRFFGLGPGSSQRDTSSYATRIQHYQLETGASWNGHSTVDNQSRSQIRAWVGPRDVITRHGREGGGVPSIEERHPDVVAATFDRRIEHLIYGMRFRSDWRRGVPHWGEGWRLEVQAQRFDRPIKALAIQTARPDGAQFWRYDYLIETGTSFMRDPRTLRLGVRVVDQEISGNPAGFLVTDLAKLGGREGLAGFEPGRFQDLDLAIAKLTYVWPLLRRMEMEVHVETGGVYSDVWRAPTIPGLQTSWGLSLRPRFDRPIGSVGVEFSKETTRFRFSIGGAD